MAKIVIIIGILLIWSIIIKILLEYKNDNSSNKFDIICTKFIWPLIIIWSIIIVIFIILLIRN